MGVLDFLKVARKASPAAAIAEMEQSLLRLRIERAQANELVELHAPKRAMMLLSDATEEAILALDREADIARLRLDRLELAEIELQDRIASARDKAERDRRAAEAERAANAISSKTSAVDEAATALAMAFAALVEAIPADLIDTPSRKDGFTVALPASPGEIARAIVAQALATSAPDLFENRPSIRCVAGASIEKFLRVAAVDSSGRLSPVLEGERGELASISSASSAADRIIITPLRAKAAALRVGENEMPMAAE